MLRNILDILDKMRELPEGGVELEQITSLDLFDKIVRMKYKESTDSLKALATEISKNVY